MRLKEKLFNSVGLLTREQAIAQNAKITAELETMKKESSEWAKLFQLGQEFKMFGDKPTNPYSQIPSVYKAIKAIADNVPQADLKFYDKKSDKEITDDPITVLFDNPNPLMTESDFMQSWIGFNCLYGESIIVMVKSLGQIAGTKNLPAQLWPFNPKKFTEVTQDLNLTGWRHDGTGQLFSPDEIMFMKDFNPQSLFRGLAPTEPIDMIIDIDWNTLIYNKIFFQNDATPGLVLSTKDKLNKEIVERLRSQWEERHKGSHKAWKVAILESGLEPKATSSTHKEMDFLEQKRFTREEIYGIWRAPKALFNVTEDLNYATFVGQMKIFWNYTIMPNLQKARQKINSQIVNPYNPKIEARWDISNVVAYQEDLKEKVTTGKELFAMGFTGNEINKKLQLGFDDKPWRDYFWISFGLVPADPEAALANNTAAPANPDNAEDPDAKPGEKLPIPDNSDQGKDFADLRKLAYWRNFLTKQIPIENKLTGVVSRFFFEQRKAVLSQFIKEQNISIDWQKQDESLKGKVKGYLRLAVQEGVNIGKESLNKKGLEDDAFNHKLESFLALRTDKITKINKTIKGQIKNSLEEGISEGETIQELSDRIRDVYNMATARALTISRTETIGAVNGGSYLYYEKENVNSKQWLTARDEAVRETHRELEGEIVLLNESFSNGLSYPGDQGGSPEEVINCRCTILPVL
jgi:HK97 family phage portal protein